MYSLDCTYYKEEFYTLEELLDNIVISGMDPNYFITKDGISTNEMAINLLIF